MSKQLLLVVLVSLGVLIVSGITALSSWNLLSGDSRSEAGITTDRLPVDAASDSLSPVRVAVLNGCGRPGIASVFVQKLRKDGMDVVNGMGGNANSFEFDRSVVVDRRGNRERADMVARSLGIDIVLDQRSESPYLVEEVVVVIGRDWDTLLFPGKEMPD